MMWPWVVQRGADVFENCGESVPEVNYLESSSNVVFEESRPSMNTVWWWYQSEEIK